jgi:curli biogenesis system outer membrane secretion channel CsgG
MLRTIRLLCLSLIALSCVAHAQEQPKRLVAVLDFDSRAVDDNAAALYGSSHEVGRGMAALLTEKLLKDGRYRVIERKAMDSMLAEQNIPINLRTDPAALAKVGKLMGLDGVIVGSVTKFNRKESHPDTLSAARLKKGELKAVCGLNAFLVDTRTGEILISATGEGESSGPGTSFFKGGWLSQQLFDENNDSGSNIGFDIYLPNFDQTLMGEAVTKAINSIGTQLDSRATFLPARRLEISALVADVNDNLLTINMGGKTGLKVGDRLEIVRTVRLIPDPKTGKILRVLSSKIGDGTVIEVNTEFATLSFKGAEDPKIGDTATTQHELWSTLPSVSNGGQGPAIDGHMYYSAH